MKRLATYLKSSSVFFFVAAVLFVQPVYAGCTSPTGNEGDRLYNGDYHTYQFCNGTGWLAYGGGATCTPSGGSTSPTAPSRSGYLVMSLTTYNSNLSGRYGADVDCLTDLTTHTSWAGYSTANSNGQLVASKVHALLCDTNICTNLLPLATYIFADANNAAHGGASFTTDSSGNGPNDSASWAASDHFGSTYTYWTNMNTTSATAWSGSPYANTGGNTAASWTSSSGQLAGIGISNSSIATRWNNGLVGNTGASYNLLCYVNP